MPRRLFLHMSKVFYMHWGKKSETEMVYWSYDFVIKPVLIRASVSKYFSTMGLFY